MSDAPLISVVILSWNRIDDLRDTLRVLREDPYPQLEVIVVDNASGDGTQNMLRQEFPEIRLIELDRNIGIAGWNAGFEVARGKYVLVLDDDSYPEPGAIGQGASYMEDTPACGVAGFRVMNLRMDAEETAIFSPGPERMFIGCGAMIRTRVLTVIGGFDPNLFLYEHEIEFSIRAWDAGFEVHYVPDVVITHSAALKNRGIRNGKDCRRVYYTARNIPYIMLLHFSLSAVMFRLIRVSIGRWAGAVSAGCGFHALRGLISGWILGLRNRHRGTIVAKGVQEQYAFGSYAGGFFFDDPAYRLKRSGDHREHGR